MVEFVADAADVAHHGHQEVHTCGTAGSVRSHASPARCPPFSRGPFATPPHPPDGKRKEDEGTGCLARMLWLGSGGSPGGNLRAAAPAGGVRAGVLPYAVSGL